MSEIRCNRIFVLDKIPRSRYPKMITFAIDWVILELNNASRLQEHDFYAAYNDILQWKSKWLYYCK